MVGSESVTISDRDRTKGTWFVLGAYILWGLLPLYWKALIQVPPMQILAHRIIWSFVFVTLLLVWQNRWSEFKSTFRVRKNRNIIFLTAGIIGTNWFIYIWAVNNNHIVDTSLGYFINPLITVLLGVIFLHERLGFWQIVACGLAFVGVTNLTVQHGTFPWIALSLALTFGFYGLLRKTAHVESMVGLAAEIGLLSPILVIYLLALEYKGTGATGHVGPDLHLLLIGAGVVTATPILWFTIGVRKIPLSLAGFLQYLAPSLQLMLGVLVYNEPFTRTHLISFSFIWVALLMFSISYRPNRIQSTR